MEEQVLYTEQVSEKHAPVRASFRAAKRTLGKGSTLLNMVLVTLFCLLAFVALYFFFTLLVYMLSSYTLLDDELIVAVCVGAFALGVWLLLAPLLLGRLRMGGLAQKWGECMTGDLFYYFTTVTRYRRGIVLGLLYLLFFLVPIGIVGFAFLGSFLLYVNVLTLALNELGALFVLIACYALSGGILVLCVFLTGFYLPMLAVALANEERTVLSALRIGLGMVRGRMRIHYRFSMCVLLHFLLSLLTLGVLWLLYYAHHTTLAYWHLVREE